MENTGAGTSADLVPELFLRDLRSAARKGDHAAVEELLATCVQLRGRSEFYAEALSWAARAYAKKEHWDFAQQRAREALDLAEECVAGGQLAANIAGRENSISIACGAGIEVCALCLEAAGHPDDALAYLTRMSDHHAGSSFARRIHKNLLQRTLHGQPAIPLELTPFPGEDPVLISPFGTHPALLFFWAHWCSDSRSQARTLSRFFESPAAAGLQLVGVTGLFGFITKGNPAAPEAELSHLREVLAADYPVFSGKASTDKPVLLLYGQENLQRYGASTLPTMVLTNRQGIVQQYRTGQWKLEDLQRAVATLDNE